MFLFVRAALLTLTAAGLFAQPKLGHSMHGEAFDTGPREKPWVIEGIGSAEFPITTKNPEVQRWFNQGNALLHSFWDYEAERAFRWCVKLEPENPMPYWGLARASLMRGLGGKNRPAEMIREALKRRASASEREQLYIDAFAAEVLPDPLREGKDEKNSRGKKILETLCVKYPDDVEARALLALQVMGESRYGAELMIREVLSKQVDHPGAHHYRIHNWNDHEPEQALDSARRYGDIAPGIGHALHMPGHIFSTVGMWNEAAISMDAATRREKQYMQQRMTFPFNNWNYGHNRNYLAYIQEQLGMASAAIFGARQLIDAPLDPDANGDGPFTSHSQGIAALARALVKFERWDELAKEGTIPWRDIFADKVNRVYFEARVHFAKGNREGAEKSLIAHEEFKKDLEKSAQGPMKQIYEIQSEELKGRLALMRGDTFEGLKFLTSAAEREFLLQSNWNDPPVYPEVLYLSLGEVYLSMKSPQLAVQAFEKALKLTRNDIFALSGLVRAYAAAGEKAKAADAMGSLRFVAADADKDLPVLTRAYGTGIEGAPRDTSPRPQRNYARTSLEKYGPNKWESYAAPALEVKDTAGKTVRLADYKGKNVLLVFYLGQECVHCMKQLRDIGEKKLDWERLNTVVLVVSSTTPEKNAAGIKAYGDLPVRVLSDSNFVNARRFHSYDDFEEMELHSTILIDKLGRVHWSRNGGDPFSDMNFLVKQLDRMNADAVGN